MLSLHVREHDCFFFQWYGNLRELDLLTHSFPARRSSDLAEHRNEIGDQVDRRQRIGGDRDGEDAREPRHARVACGEPGGVRLDREPVADRKSTSELQSLMRISSAVLGLKKKTFTTSTTTTVTLRLYITPSIQL